MGPGPDSGSSAPSSVPHSLATSRDDEDDEDEESSGRRSNGHTGTRLSELYRRGTSSSHGGSLEKDAPELSATSTTSESLESNGLDTEIPAAARRPRSTRGSQKWSNVRAVMALYSSLRKIKRFETNSLSLSLRIGCSKLPHFVPHWRSISLSVRRTKSNQRWMKLRTTVQLSSAISTIQKKPPLKREDSFLKRFSTRQIPESQETLDTAEGEGDAADDKDSSGRRRRRPRRPQKPPKTVVNPDENFYYYWLMLLSGCVLYNLWTLIVRQSLPELQALAPATWLACDGFTDLVFFLDVAVQFRTGYLEQGLMVYNSKKLAGHYLKSKSFILDLLALLPLDILQVNLGSNPMLRFPRFLKIYRVYNYYYMVESRTVYPNLWRVLNLIHILLILAHWFGCFYYLLSEAEGFQGDWVYPYRPGEYATLTRKYLGSLYWSTLTLTTIGDLPTPETNAERGKELGDDFLELNIALNRESYQRGSVIRMQSDVVSQSGQNAFTQANQSIHGSWPVEPLTTGQEAAKPAITLCREGYRYVFTIVSYLIGVFIFATIVGQVGNVITNRNANRLEFERLLDGAKTYMRHHKVPGGMKRRVLRWYDYSWSRGRIQGGGDINTALGLLPDKLKTELALHVNLSVLKKVTIFQECQPEFLHDLVLKMKAYIFTPGDSICRKGEVAREMFIIADGILEVISETGRVLTTMKAGDFFGEIGILNLDGLNKRTADVRSVGYSELFSLSREDVLAAMKDYPEAQEILQNLGRKRLMEAQKVARASRQPTSPGHDSSDNSTGKRIVDKLKSDVKGLKNALRKSRRNTRPEESLELQPLTSKAPTLKRQQKIDDTQDASASNVQEPPVSPLGAGLPLLARLRLLKEKEEREERRNLVETQVHTPEPQPPPLEAQNPTNPNLPFLQRILLLKAKNEQEAKEADKEAPTKEPLLPKSVIPEESQEQSPKLTPKPLPKQPSVQSTVVEQIVKPPTTPNAENTNSTNAKKPWAMLKDASLTNKDNSPQRSPPTRRLQLKQSLVHLRQQTKMYASVDDLSPEYCGLPFVKKLKILNERQKLAELEKAVRSSSLDCGENTELEFDGNLTRSHSEACAIEYARKLEKLNQNRQDAASPTDQLSPENETLERRNLKSILKKLSAGSRTGSSETSATSTPDREAATAELRKLMRAPTIEGYAARHSKLSKSVTFNKYTLQSPPSEQIPANYPLGSQLSDSQEQASLPPPNKLSFRPLGSGGILQIVSRPREEEYLGELVSGISEVVKDRLEDIQTKFERQYTSLELEIRKRDEIISQLQARIQELEQRESRNADDSLGDSTEHDASLEEDLDDDREDHPFMRDGSVDTVLTTRPHYKRSSPSTESSSQNRRSWEEHSEEETLELQELPSSIVPQYLWKDEVAIDLESNSESSRSEDEFEDRATGRSDSENDEDEDGDVRRDGHNNWEVAMLAQELESRRRSSENANPGS
ncbi:Cyclic nucleotide-gated cation channel alpha-3 [Habropoda laboriosa]|uniref:Cyclic nucleotide-gated cation channel alpha-3 n=1 Tax=Habropoda laboriosa TaxID=597456 RepID=A0A0L7QV91_9HYME|nr:Cyclic nucleotide-gated cation channel alpha-3 [Habropoda laboriosa]